MHQYDLCLSNLLHAWEDPAKLLREYDSDVPDGLRLSGSVCLDCFDKDYTNTQLTDVDVDEILKRWRKLGMIRDLYLDEAISRDFEKYITLCLPQWPQYLEPSGVRPIIEESPELEIQSNSILKYAPDFKARFHQSLCLHSIARASLAHAIYSRDQPDTENDSPNLISKRLSRKVIDLWRKHQLVTDGPPVQLWDDAQFDCVEICNFLYDFLLDKVVPYSALESWTGEAAGFSSNDGSADNLDFWYSLLYQCHFMLQPLDILDLVKHKTWRADSTFPADKTRYMYDRLYFDICVQGSPNYPPWRGVGSSLQTWDANINQYKSGSWEELRTKFGSPFKSGFRQMLDLEASRVESGDVHSRNL